jgi:hypothetical protein
MTRKSLISYLSQRPKGSKGTDDKKEPYLRPEGSKGTDDQKEPNLTHFFRKARKEYGS